MPAEDPAVYDMLCNGDSVGVFQVESRAQMSMLPRLRPRCYYDLVIEVAIVRPGPIQGGMVHPYLRRRGGTEPPIYADDRVKRVLERTLGVPLFQEQAMRLVMVAASFTAGEADQLRRAMAAWKRKEHLIERLSGKIVNGMLANGYSHAYALQVVQQIRGFSGYGFPESHAASFAHLVYVSAWLKRHHPAAFAAALINSQPMGFYQPAQIVRDAKDHGVTVLPVDVNHSGWDCRLETQIETLNAERRTMNDPNAPFLHPHPTFSVPHPTPNVPHPTPNVPRSAFSVPRSAFKAPPALRLGMRLISRMREEEARTIESAVAQHGPFTSIEQLWRATSIRVATLRALAAADAFTSLGLTRQRALWEILRLRDNEMPLFDMHEAQSTEAQRHKGTEALSGNNPQSLQPLSASVPQSLSASTCPLPPIAPLTQVVHDYAATGLSLKAHPLSFARPGLNALRVTPTGELADEKLFPHGKRIAVAGLVLVRQRPSTASGILFVTLEDETGVANLVVRPNIYEKYRRPLRQSVALVAWGKLERAGQVVHILVERAQNINELPTPTTPTTPPSLQPMSRDFH